MREEEAMGLLVSAQGVSYGRREMALRAAGSAEAVLQEPAAYGAQLGQNGVQAVRRSAREAERRIDAWRAQNVRLVARGTEGYPKRLAQIARPPHLLFVWGEVQLDDTCPLAIVGTRHATAYGLNHTRVIARELAQAGMCVVSGLAVGIDAAAHQGALDAGGRTIAVLGGALDRFYPAENRPLMRRILDAGGSIVTEYPMGMPPSAYSFLHRNRIIAGMTLGVLVAEGGRRSGAMRTAHDALEEGREVFALPGDVDRLQAWLPNHLIAEGAHMATCAQDILEQLVIEPAGGIPKQAYPTETEQKEQPKKTPAAPKGLDEAESSVYRALSAGEKDFDALCEQLHMGAEELGTLLMMMELDGLIEARAGTCYALANDMTGI